MKRVLSTIVMLVALVVMAGCSRYIKIEMVGPKDAPPCPRMMQHQGIPPVQAAKNIIPGDTPPPTMMDMPRIPLIGESAPSFKAETTQGEIHFPEDYKGSWVILFSHPADFTPVCTTEFMTFAKMQDEFAKLNTKLIGLSIDGLSSHIAWLRTIKEKLKYKDMSGMEVTFPLIADIKMDVANKYGMVQPSASNTKAVRAVFFIDPESKIRALIYYPLSNGRNFQEIKRLLIAMQTSDKHGVATPADWQPGDEVIVPPPGSCGSAKERVEGAQAGGYHCDDWFFCFKKLEGEQK